MIILFLLSFNLYASEWTKASFYPSSWGDEKSCKAYSSEPCYKLDHPVSVYDKVITNGVVSFQLNQSKLDEMSAGNSKKELIARELMNESKCRMAIATVRYYNKSRNLSKAQRQAMRTSMKPIIELLIEGDADGAKELIQAVTPDGVVITEAIKQEVLGLL